MRVLLISNIFPPAFVGGYELAARDVARALTRRGHGVTVLSSPPLDGAPDPPEPFAVLRTLVCTPFSNEFASPADRAMRGTLFDLGNLGAVAPP